MAWAEATSVCAVTGLIGPFVLKKFAIWELVWGENRECVLFYLSCDLEAFPPFAPMTGGNGPVGLADADRIFNIKFQINLFEF